MTLTIYDTAMTSDQIAHTARRAPGSPHLWEVSWLPGRAARPGKRAARPRGGTMTTRPRRPHDRKPEPADAPRRTPGPLPPGGDTTAAASPAGQDPPSGRLACSVDEAARLTGLSRDLLCDEMRRGNLADVKVGRRRLITRQHLQQFLGIAS